VFYAQSLFIQYSLCSREENGKESRINIIIEEIFGRMDLILAKDLINIKGTRDGLVILFDPNREIEEIKKNLRQKIEATKGFLRGARFTLHQAKPLNAQHRVELENICQQYGLIPSPDIRWRAYEQHEHREKERPIPSPDIRLSVNPAQNKSDDHTRLVFSSLRSGQQINCPGNLVLLGDVHPGARILAQSDVIIMGKCLGDIYAGEPDCTEATVVALKLAPNRLTIAGVTAEKPDSKSGADNPLMAVLKNGKIVFRPYQKATKYII